MNSSDYSTTSPCINRCCLSEQDICLGCFRSLEEIKQWTLVDNKTREVFLYNAALRRAHIAQKPND